MPTKNQKKSPDEYLRWSGLAFKMIGIILAGFFGGRKLDQIIRFKFPVFTLSLGLGALVLSFYSLFKEISRKP